MPVKTKKAASAQWKDFQTARMVFPELTELEVKEYFGLHGLMEEHNPKERKVGGRKKEYGPGGREIWTYDMAQVHDLRKVWEINRERHSQEEKAEMETFAKSVVQKFAVSVPEETPGHSELADQYGIDYLLNGSYDDPCDLDENENNGCDHKWEIDL